MSRTVYAHVEEINAITPIDGADRIVLATVLGWHVVVNKSDNFKVGDKCIYIEIDSYVDLNKKCYDFLKNKGAHIKTIKLRGVYSQGLILPLCVYGLGYHRLKVGDDVTRRMHVYGPDEWAEKRNAETNLNSMKGLRKFFYMHKHLRWIGKLFHVYKEPVVKKTIPIPAWVVKTDEIRIQANPNIPTEWKEYNAANGTTVVATEKIDGQSTTFTLKKRAADTYDYYVCSRACAIDPDNPTSPFALEAKKHNAKQVLIDIFNELKATDYVTLQGETICKSVRNSYYLKDGETHIYIFNLIVDGFRYGSPDMAKIVEKYGFDTVPLLSTDFTLANTVDDILLQADGDTAIYPGHMREGIVFRTSDGQKSFKAVSNKYLLKHEE
jgi:hypothetical protein